MQTLGEEHGFEVDEFSWLTTDKRSRGKLLFNTFVDTYKFCRKNIQLSFLTFFNGWYENYSGDIATGLLRDIKFQLNNDCIAEIADRLDIVGVADLLSVGKNDAAMKQFVRSKYSNWTIDEKTVGRAFGIMNLCYVLHEMGDIFEHITISLYPLKYGGSRYFKKPVYAILYHINRLTSPTLKSITLKDFEIDKNTPQIRSLFSIFRQRNVVVSSNMTPNAHLPKCQPFFAANHIQMLPKISPNKSLFKVAT